MATQNADINGAARPVDDKGRILVSQLSHEEKIDELLVTARHLQDLVDKFLSDPNGPLSPTGPMAGIAKMLGRFM